MSIDQHFVSFFFKFGAAHLPAKREKRAKFNFRHACHTIRNTGITDKQAFGTLATLPQQPKIQKTSFLSLKSAYYSTGDWHVSYSKCSYIGLSNKTK